jgi:hypothetical protein
MDERLLEFIRSVIKSVWALELLLFLRRHSGRRWTSDELIRESRSSRIIVNETIKVFVQAGILSQDDIGCQYIPVNAELVSLIDEIAREYEERPVSIVNAIVREQSGKLQDFANAFRIKRD